VSAPIIPWFAEKPSHHFVPIGRRPAGARSEGQGRPSVGASRAAFTGASALAGWRRSGAWAAVGLAMLLVAPDAVLAQNGPGERAAAQHPYAVHVTDAAQRFGIPAAWIWAVMRVESNGDVRAVSTAGAMGLMQIMPATWANLCARHRLGSDPFDPRDNIMAGAAYLREMFDRYGNATAMLAAYNAGPGRYNEHLSRGRPLPAETRAYLAKLAAITGDSGDTQLAAAPPLDPFAWHRAALFTVRSGAAMSAQPTTDDEASRPQSERPPTDRTDGAALATKPSSPGLFVAVSGRSPP